MGLFSSNKSTFPWIQLTSITQFEELMNSNGKFLIFKHSTRCNISSMALNRFEREYDQTKTLSCYFLDLLNHRDVSNQIENTTSITHQSPQVIIIENREILHNSSHEKIDAQLINTI